MSTIQIQHFESHTSQRLGEIVEIYSKIIELKLVLNVFNDCLAKVGKHYGSKTQIVRYL